MWLYIPSSNFFEMSFGNKIVLGLPLTLGYVVLFPGIFAFLFWIKGIDIIGANRSGVFLHLMTIFGALMAIVILAIMFYHFLGSNIYNCGYDTFQIKVKKMLEVAILDDYQNVPKSL